jgi:hypothetical protein
MDRWIGNVEQVHSGPDSGLRTADVLRNSQLHSHYFLPPQEAVQFRQRDHGNGVFEK